MFAIFGGKENTGFELRRQSSSCFLIDNRFDIVLFIKNPKKT